MIASSWGTDTRAIEHNERWARRLPWIVGCLAGLLGGLPIGLIVALLVDLVIGLWAGLAVGVGVAVAVAVTLAARTLDLVLAEVQWVPADSVAHARLLNVVESTSAMAGIGEVEVGIIDSSACNTLTAATRNRSVILFTSGVLEALDLMELEGLVAREVARLRSGDAWLLASASVTVGLPLLLAQRRGSVLGRALAPLSAWSARSFSAIEAGDRVMRADVDAVSLTRYPPGLESALRVISQCDNAVAGVPRVASAMSVTSPLDPGECAVHPALSVRIDMLTEL